jgi:hypothetical protein
VSTSINVSGPVFDGRAEAECARICDEAERDVAAQGYSDVMATLNARIQHPTPYYETQVTVTKEVGGRLIHDRGIVYGPWLEGTSPRNRSTRFKGYRAFTLARLALPSKARALVQNAVNRGLGRL